MQQYFASGSTTLLLFSLLYNSQIQSLKKAERLPLAAHDEHVHTRMNRTNFTKKKVKVDNQTPVLSPFSRAVQAVLLYRLQNAKYRLDSAGQLP
jgi:hypothetical protein